MGIKGPRNVAHSVRARLTAYALREQIATDYCFLRYACERFLFRLGKTPYAERFILKGAAAFTYWVGARFRTTRDTDLEWTGPLSHDHLRNVFSEICGQVCEDDGVVFFPDTLLIEDIREDADYTGVRVTLIAGLEQARVTLKFDIGTGDAVYPAPEHIDYPVLLDGFEAPSVKIYPIYTIIAEKYEAIVSLGLLNSRVKDYFDLWALFRTFEPDGEILRSAVTRTFRRRGTPLPTECPVGLSPQFCEDTQKGALWRAFLKKNNITDCPTGLCEIGQTLSERMDALGLLAFPAE